MWEISAYNQLISVACSVICGGALCVFYDIIRAARKGRRTSFLAVFISDVLFCCFCAVAVFFVMLGRTDGEIRGYIIFATALGFVLFRLSLSKITYSAFSFVFKILSKFFALIRKIIRKACLFVVGGLSFLGGKINIIFLSFKKLLKNSRRVLYNKKNQKKAGENADGG